MSYNKPMVIAQNSAAGSFAAGCPPEYGNDGFHGQSCRQCERSN